MLIEEPRERIVTFCHNRVATLRARLLREIVASNDTGGREFPFLAIYALYFNPRRLQFKRNRPPPFFYSRSV